MQLHYMALVLTVLNLTILGFTLTRSRPVAAESVPAVLRARSLEIVDAQGRVRASIKVQPADANFRWPDGRKGYPETVMLRLSDERGRPEVKLGASVNGAGLGLLGADDATQILLQSEGAETSLTLKEKSGQQHTIQPE